MKNVLSKFSNDKGSNISITQAHRNPHELWKIARMKVLSYIRMKHQISFVRQRKENSTLLTYEFLANKHDFLWYWDINLSFFLLYSCLVSPYILAFGYSHIFNVYFAVDIVTDAVFLLNLLIKTVSARFSKENNSNDDRYIVFKNYLQHHFILDLLISFPYEIISVISNQPYESFHSIHIFVRWFDNKALLAAFRLFRFLKYLASCSSFFLIEKMHNLIALSYTSSKLLRTLVSILIFIHIVACFWCYVEKLDTSINTWVYRNNLSSVDSSTRYLKALYFILTTLSTVGYGDFTPRTSYEIGLAGVWMIAAVYLLSFNVSSLNSLIIDSDFRKTILENKLKLIDIYSKNEKITRPVRHKIKREVKEKILRMSYSADERKEIIAYLPIEIKYEIALTMHNGVIEEFPFFCDKDKEFIGSIFPLLYSKIYKPGETIFMQNQKPFEVYFIAKGSVNFNYGDENAVFRCLSIGQYFADFEVIHQRSLSFAVVASDFAHFLVMPSDAYEYFKKDFKSIWTEFKELSKQRQSLNIKALAEMIIIRKMNAEKRLTKVTSTELRQLIEIQVGILSHRNIEITLEEFRQREANTLIMTLKAQGKNIHKVLEAVNCKYSSKYA